MNRPFHNDLLSATPEGQTDEDIREDFVAEGVEWLPGISPVTEWDKNDSRRALDDLFSTARQYRTSQAYKDLLDFVSRFLFYSPFNAMLIHVQMRGARFVAPAHRWLQVYSRHIKPNARPLVILQPMGPVMFVFDVSDTEPEPNAPPLPPAVLNPF